MGLIQSGLTAPGQVQVFPLGTFKVRKGKAFTTEKKFYCSQYVF
jgi:hypothetical protein